MIIVKGFQPLTIITKHSILDVAAALDPPLRTSAANQLNVLMRLRNRLGFEEKKILINSFFLLKFKLLAFSLDVFTKKILK